MDGRLGLIRSGLLVIVLLASAACSGGDDPEPQNSAVVSTTQPRVEPTPSLDPLVQAIRSQALDPLFSAIRKGETEPLKDLLHPEAAVGLEVNVPKLASGFETMNIEDLKYGTGATAGEATTGHARTLGVAGSYTIPGIEGTFDFGGTFHFLESATRWKLADIRWSGAPVWRVPGPLTRSESSGAVVFHAPDFPGKEVADFAAASVERLKKLGAADGAPYLIMVAGEDYNVIAGSGSIAAAMNRIEWTGERFETGTPFVALRSSSYLSYDAALRKAVVVHELTHAALSPDVTFFTPEWLSEGLAVYYSDELGLGALKPRGDTGYLDAKKVYNLDGQFSNGFDPDITDAYSYSGAVVAMLSERFGEKSVLDLHDYFKSAMTADEINNLYDVPFLLDQVRTNIESETSRKLSDQFFAERFQMSSEDVDAATKQWVRDHW